jgi:hypothetical protein
VLSLGRSTINNFSVSISLCSCLDASAESTNSPCYPLTLPTYLAHSPYSHIARSLAFLLNCDIFPLFSSLGMSRTRTTATHVRPHPAIVSIATRSPQPHMSDHTLQSSQSPRVHHNHTCPTTLSNRLNRHAFTAHCPRHNGTRLQAKWNSRHVFSQRGRVGHGCECCSRSNRSWPIHCSRAPAELAANHAWPAVCQPNLCASVRRPFCVVGRGCQSIPNAAAHVQNGHGLRCGHCKGVWRWSAIGRR